MDTNKMREQFESFASEVLDWSDDEFRLASDGKSYYWGTTGEAWVFWQASREAVVVEPVWPDHYDYTNSDVAGAALLDCRTAFQKAMKAQGLKVEVKP